MVPANRVGNVACVERSVGKRVLTLWANARLQGHERKCERDAVFSSGTEPHVIVTLSTAMSTNSSGSKTKT